MSNFKMWFSANVQLLRKPENRKIAPMLAFGDRLMGKGKGMDGQFSELRGILWFARASAAAATKAANGKKPAALVIECNEMLERLEKRFKGNDNYAYLFEIAYETRAAAKKAAGMQSAGSDFAKAKEYDRIAEENEKRAEANMARLVKFEKGDYAGTVEACTEAIEANPNDAAPYYLRSLAKFKLGDRSAIADCDKARELNPKGTYNYPGLSQHQATVEDCNMAVMFYPGRPEPYLGRAGKRRYGNPADLAGAVEDFTKAIELLRKMPETLENLRMLSGALYGRSNAKYSRSEVSSFFYESNYSGWKEDQMDSMALSQRIFAMEKQAKKEKKPVPAGA